MRATKPCLTALLAFLLLALAGCVSPKPVEVVEHSPWPTASSTPSPTVTRASVVKNWRPTPATFTPRPPATLTPTATATPTAIPPMPPPTQPITAENIARLVPYARVSGGDRVVWFNGGQRLGVVNDRELRIYAAPHFAGGEVFELPYPIFTQVDVFTHNDYGDLALFQLEGDLVIWDIARGERVGESQGGGFVAVRSPAGHYFARIVHRLDEGSIDIEVYDLNGNPIQTFPDKGGWPFDIQFSPDETRLAVSSEVGPNRYKVWVWDIASGALLNVIEWENAINNLWIAFNTVADQLVVAASGIDDPTIRVWDFALGGWTGAAWHFGPGYGDITRLRISPDGDMIFFRTYAIGMYPHTSLLIDSRTGEQLPLPSLAWEVQDVLFSPDGLYAAVQYEDETIIHIVGQ